MTNNTLYKLIYFLLITFVLFTSCNGQISTQSDSLNKIKTRPIGQTKLIKTQSANLNNGVACSLQDKVGNLWFGIPGEGVYRYDGKLFTQYTVQDGLNHNNVWSICEDKNGNLWFGTSDGVCRFDGNTFSPITITIKNGSDLQLNGAVKLNNKISVNNYGNVSEENAVWSIIQDQKGTLWFGTTEGIYQYDGTSFTSFTHTDGIINNTGFAINKVESILEDKTGKIWFGGRFTDGLFCLDGNTLNHFNPDGDNWFVPLIEDKSGNIWFSTRLHSVYRYDGKSFTNYVDKALHGWVIAMAEDNNGNLWFSTEKGVAKFDGNNMTALTVADGLKEDNIYDLFCDASGTIWIGTRGMGLYSYDGKLLTNYSE